MADVSRLDYFAGQALLGLILRETLQERDSDGPKIKRMDGTLNPDIVVENAWEIAAAMLEEEPER